MKRTAQDEREIEIRISNAHLVHNLPINICNETPNLYLKAKPIFFT